MKTLRLIATGAAALTLVASASAAGGAQHAEGPEGGFPFEGPMGQFDKRSVQRGYQVYKEVCSSCHSMELMRYRNLGETGGPYYDPQHANPGDNPLVKALAAENEILDPVPNDIGEYDYRPATPADAFRSPYPNDNAARAANGGALPPDLSVIVKARHGGADYIYNLLTGYPDYELLADRVVTKPDGTEDYQTIMDVAALGLHGEHHYEGTLIQPVGQYYNPYMAGDTTPQFEGDPRHAPPGGFLAMGPQLLEGRVTYLDNTEATPHQMAYDVAQFLAWASEPKQTTRKQLGAATMGYLAIFAVLLYLSYRRIWRNVEH